jgi:hypothetical protein
MSDKKDSYSARQVPFITVEWPGDDVAGAEPLRGIWHSPDGKVSKDKWKDVREWHLAFQYKPGMPCPFPIVPEGTRDRHDAVGHLTPDGRVHVFNDGIVEQLVRAGLRARV